MKGVNSFQMIRFSFHKVKKDLSEMKEIETENKQT